MEASSANDPFADAAPGGPANDPFADPPAGDDLAAEVAAEAPGEIPVVDREGEPVPAPAEGADPAAAAPAVVNEDETPVAAPEQTAADTGELDQPSDHMAPGEPVAAQQAEGAAEAPQGPQSAPEPPAEAPAQPEAAPEPPAAPEPAAAPAPAASTAGGDGAAPAPTRAKGEMRHYKAFYQTAANTWSEYPLTGTLPEGVKVVTVEGELFFEARNNDHATRIAFALLGQPQDGVTIWPVPKGAYKPKRVKPAPPKPERTRLEIS